MLAVAKTFMDETLGSLFRTCHDNYDKCCQMQALVSVAGRFLRDIPDLDESTRTNVANHMAFSHQSVTQASQRSVLYLADFLPNCCIIFFFNKK